MLKYHIKTLKIKRYRCFKEIEINPVKGVNVVVGCGDSGKSTLLTAIALVASQDCLIELVETDYYGKEVKDKFEIVATIACENVNQNWPINGFQQSAKNIEEFHDPCELNSEHNNNELKEFKLRVEGTPQLKPVYSIYDIVGMDFDIVGMEIFEVNSVANSLAEIYISGLNKPVNYPQSIAIASNPVAVNSGGNSKLEAFSSFLKRDGDISLYSQHVQLVDLRKAFQENNLPLINQFDQNDDVNIVNLVNLELEEVHLKTYLPLQSWGDGTIGLAKKLFMERNQIQSPIRLVENFCANLDITKQRNFFKYINQSNTQSFIIVNQPEIVRLAEASSILWCRPFGEIGRLEGDRISQFQKSEPNILFSKLVIFGEGKTEVGFNIELYNLALEKGYEFHGIVICNGGGHENTLNLAEQLTLSKLKVSTFVDFEDESYINRWQELIEISGKRIYQWRTGSIEENVISSILSVVEIDCLHQFIMHPDPQRTNKRLQSLAFRHKNLNINRNATPKEAVDQILQYIEKSKEIKKFVGVERKKAAFNLLKRIIIEAASGFKPAGIPDNQRHIYKGHGSDWFKSIEGGQELAEKMFLFGAWGQTEIKDLILPNIKANLNVIGTDQIDDLPVFNPTNARWTKL